MDEINEATLFKKGAEASIYLANWHGYRVILKKRLPKTYRHHDLDTRIRTYRTIHEPQLIHEAKKAGVPTPAVFQVNAQSSVITMQFIDGKQLKTCLNDISETSRKEICTQIGKSVGKLHRHGIIHGDLTTSNMILSPPRTIFFIDFGLGEKNIELEAMGIDLHLMRRALESTHFQFSEECFKNVFDGYQTIVGTQMAGALLNKMMEIRKRGRYVSERKEEK
jgi:TP53 regulating kinase-like protein